ncbi:universal stress protein [Halopenitus sp. H-Gu1]|uniref:universal stress protein n=1 Tax=Halopenitus sp. H-Gu1 TaxID=3242697 RepID=UPI00359DA089
MKVLLGIGGSEDSFRALERTVDRARAAGDDIVVAVVENPDTDRSHEEVTERVRSVVDEADIEVEVRHIEGDPGSQIVEIAEREGFDQIVLGGGHTSPMGKITLGNIAEFVLLNAKTTVTLVR